MLLEDQVVQGRGSEKGQPHLKVMESGKAL